MMVQAQRSSPLARSARSAGKGSPVRSGSGTSSDQSADAQNNALVSRLGPFEIDWPRSLGYFGAVGLAVGVGLLDPPAALFIAAVPFLKMLDVSHAPQAARFLGQVFEGMAKPVGGDSQGTVRIASPTAGVDAQPVSQSG